MALLMLSYCSRNFGGVALKGPQVIKDWNPDAGFLGGAVKGPELAFSTDYKLMFFS
jgi:hypothetical protein